MEHLQSHKGGATNPSTLPGATLGHFLEEVQGMDHLWARGKFLGVNYCCRSVVSGAGEEVRWELVCVDLDARRVWQRTVRWGRSLMANTLGMQVSWEVYFKLFKEGFLKDDLFINTEESNLLLTVWGQHNEKQISFNFYLEPPANDEGSEERFALFVFSMVDALRSNYLPGPSRSDTYSSLSVPTMSLSCSSSFIVPSGGGLTDKKPLHLTLADPTRNKLKNQVGVKRKGGSLLNPNVKRKAPVPTKIGVV